MSAQAELLDRFRSQVIEVFQEMGEPVAALKKIREKLKDLPKQEIKAPAGHPQNHGSDEWPDHCGSR